MLPQSVQNPLNMLQVFYPSIVVDEDFIQIHHHKIISERSRDIIHHPHESWWGICQAKGHDQPFKKAFLWLEGSLPYICLFYQDVVVARLKINITEVFSPRELIKEVVDFGNQVPISDCDFIQSLVINAESPGSIFLLYQHDWAPARWWAGMDVPLMEKFLDLSLDLLIL